VFQSERWQCDLDPRWWRRAFHSNGVCNADASLVGGLHITSAGPGLITVERRLELVDNLADAGSVKLIDKWTGTFDQINRTFQVDEVCPNKTITDAGWNGAFPTALDGGATTQVRIRFADVHIMTKTGVVTALITFTKP
jgi:hypothetical protein